MSTRRQVLAGLASAGFVSAGLLGGRAWAAPVTLRAGDQKGGTQSVMQAAGVLDGLPYRLEWNQFGAAAPVLEALNADAIDLALAGDAPATFALAAGLRARIISPVRTSGAGTAILVGNASPIRSAADLKGRTVAVNRGSIGHSLVLAVAAAQGWPFAAITIANLLPGEAKTALSTGAVDACAPGACMWPGAADGSDARSRGWPRIADWPVLPACDGRCDRAPARRPAGFLPPLGGLHGSGRRRIRTITLACWLPRSASRSRWRGWCSIPTYPSPCRSTQA